MAKKQEIPMNQYQKSKQNTAGHSLFLIALVIAS
jgi:hypothetical protein